MRTTAYVKDDSEQISVSDGGGISALPSGECGPSVRLAYSPSESSINEEYRCPGGQVVDAAGCELCGPISNADCPYWPDEIQSSCGGDVRVGANGANSLHHPEASGVTPGPQEAISESSMIMEVLSEAPASAPTKALETDPVWADDAPLFLQKREA